MLLRITFFGAANILTGILLVLIAGMALRRRRVSGATEFSLLMLSLAIYSVGLAFESMSLSLEQAIIWKRVQYAGIAWIPMFAYLFAARLCALRVAWKRSLSYVLFALSLFVLVAHYTTMSHGLYHRDVHLEFLGSIASYSFTAGPIMFLFIAYLFGSMLTLIVLMARRAAESGPFFRRQALLILIGAVIPLTADAVYLLGLTPAQLDIAPLSFGFMAIFAATALFRARLFDLTPIALRQVFNTMPTGCIILDETFRLVESNPPSTIAFPGIADLSVGDSVLGLFEPWPELCERLQSADEFSEPTVRGIGTNARCFRVDVSRIRDKRERIIAQILMVYETTTQYQLAERLRTLATYDELTGVLNRRSFFDLLTRALHTHERSGNPVSLLMLDLDHFKKINDNLGHPVGDVVLNETARRISRVLRAGDLLCRFGGEEFLALLPDTDLDQARSVAGRIRHAISGYPVSVPAIIAESEGDRDVRVTMSIGVATACCSANGETDTAGPGPLAARTRASARKQGPDEKRASDERVFDGEPGISRDAFISRADAALYEAKEAGRNTVRVSPTLIVEPAVGFNP